MWAPIATSASRSFPEFASDRGRLRSSIPMNSSSISAIGQMLADIAHSARTTNLLLRLLRETSLRELPDAAVRQRFFIGDGESHLPFRTEIGGTWWRPPGAARTLAALAKEIRNRLHKTAMIDRATAESAVETALQDNSLNRILLDCLSSSNCPNTLFEVYEKAGPSKAVEIFWGRIIVEIESTIDEWIFVYPLRLASAPTKQFSSQGACIVSSTDDSTFDRLSTLVHRSAHVFASHAAIRNIGSVETRNLWRSLSRSWRVNFHSKGCVVPW